MDWLELRTSTLLFMSISTLDRMLKMHFRMCQYKQALYRFEHYLKQIVTIAALS